MTDPDYEDDKLFLFLLIDHPVIPDAKPVVIFLCAGKFDNIVFQNIGVFGFERI